MSIIGKGRIGEDVIIALDATSGNVGDVNSIVAKMRPGAQSGGVFKFTDGGMAISLTVSDRSASGNVPAGWNLLLTAAQSADLAPGLYGIDAKLIIAGGVEITDQSAVVELTRSAFP